MISALQSKLQNINSLIAEENINTIPKNVTRKTEGNPWMNKKYSEQLELLIKYFGSKYPSHPENLISTSCKSLLDKFTTNPEKSENVIILSEKGDRIVDLKNITWKKRRLLHFQFCNSNVTCSNDEIDNIRKKIRELYSLTELHLI